MKTRLRIILLGYIVRGPVGGMAWHHLQYVKGLADLGHDVYFLEDSDDYPSCYDPTRYVTDTDPTYGLQFAATVFDRMGLADKWAYYDAHTSRWYGPCTHRILEMCQSADLLLNISGVNPLREWVMRIPARAFVDTDPVFTQIRHLTDPVKRKLALQHTAFLSFGENIIHNSSRIPKDELPWQATRQPIVLNAWPVTSGPPHGKFTTVMQWDSYPAQEFGGIRYGVKSDSFGSYIGLPERAGRVLEIALGSATAPRDLFITNGWSLRNPLEVALDPWTYQDYIRQSKAEFSVAKHGYVVSGSGWFSERSAVYLASGRPVLTQETGFSDWLEAGSGIIPFNDVEEALAGIEEINNRYEFHCRAAREIAEQYFDARKILPRLIERAMNPAPVNDSHEVSS